MATEPDRSSEDRSSPVTGSAPEVEGVEELRHELMVTKASERYNAEYARAFELERNELQKRLNKALEELAYLRLQRDKLLEITWLDGPGEPWESTSKWREQFERGWVRRAEAQNDKLTHSAAVCGGIETTAKQQEKHGH